VKYQNVANNKVEIVAAINPANKPRLRLSFISRITRHTELWTVLMIARATLINTVASAPVQMRGVSVQLVSTASTIADRALKRLIGATATSFTGLKPRC